MFDAHYFEKGWRCRLGGVSSSTLTLRQSVLRLTFIIFAVFNVCNNAGSPLTV